MPTYEYHCLNCDNAFEKIQPMSSKPFVDCPECDTEVRRSISGGMGIIFKGSGFYVNDYKKKDETKNKNPANPDKNVSKKSTEKKKEINPSSSPTPSSKRESA